MRLIGDITFAAILLTSHVAFARPEHNAFLDKPVFSTADLLKQLHSDSEVRGRYERHFKMSEPTLVYYFKGLHLEALKQDKRYLVFNVDDHFVIHHRLLHLKKGVLVFADDTHTAVLKRSCGNPMIAYLPALGENTPKLHLAKQVAVASTRTAQAADLLDPLSQSDDTTLAGAPPGLPADTLVADESTPPQGSGLAFTPAPSVPLVGSDLPVGLVGGNSLLGLIGLAGITGGILLDHGNNPPGGNPAVVPELPASAPMAFGVVGLSYFIRRRRR
jgi:hypothetical protein